MRCFSALSSGLTPPTPPPPTIKPRRAADEKCAARRRSLDHPTPPPTTSSSAHSSNLNQLFDLRIASRTVTSFWRQIMSLTSYGFKWLSLRCLLILLVKSKSMTILLWGPKKLYPASTKSSCLGFAANRFLIIIRAGKYGTNLVLFWGIPF